MRDRSSGYIVSDRFRIKNVLKINTLERLATKCSEIHGEEERDQFRAVVVCRG